MKMQYLYPELFLYCTDMPPFLPHVSILKFEKHGPSKTFFFPSATCQAWSYD